MRLRIATPTAIVLDQSAEEVVAEAPDGAFCLLPRHIDMAAALVPGILVYDAGGQRHYVAVDEGVLVKHGDEVHVATRRAAVGGELEALRAMVEAQYRRLDEVERQARSAAARLEAGFIRRYVEWKRAHHG